MNDIENSILLFGIHAQRSKSLPCTAVRTYKGNIILPRYCRPFCKDLTANRARPLFDDIFHILTTFQGRTAEAVHILLCCKSPSCISAEVLCKKLSCCSKLCTDQPETIEPCTHCKLWIFVLLRLGACCLLVFCHLVQC